MPLETMLANRQTLMGGTVVAVMVLLALFAPLIAPYPYDAYDLGPGRQNLGPTADHWLGTDDLGRDILSRLLTGARVSLAVGLGVELFDLVVGTLLGLVSGFYRGRLDTLLMRFTDVMFAFPDLLLAIFIAGLLLGDPSRNPVYSFLAVFVALAVVSWPNLARIVRGQTLALREREFVEAARAMGASDGRILFRHLLPNLLGPVVVAVTTGMASMVLAESTLSFLGIGVQPPFPSWGSMINDGRSRLLSNPTQVFFPAGALALTVLGFNFLGDGLRDRLDPRMRRG